MYLKETEWLRWECFLLHTRQGSTQLRIRQALIRKTGGLQERGCASGFHSTLRQTADELLLQGKEHDGDGDGHHHRGGSHGVCTYLPGTFYNPVTLYGIRRFHLTGSQAGELE